jgi:hypothetical protein
MYSLLRKALFATDPETAHGLALDGLRLGQRFGASKLLCKAQSTPVTVMGLKFSNPVGMAAGMDKNGDYIDALGSVGFGFIEIGTVTPRAQPGNAKPRVFRIEKAQAMINRLGFNNKGVDHLVKQARNRKLLNFSVLVSHVCVPPAIKALLDSEESRIDGFLAAGHVCTVMGTEEYLPIAEKYRVPLVVTGFEPLDILLGIFETVKMLEEGRYGVVNAYTRSVREQGNQAAQELLGEVFESTDSEWRGIGNIPSSGLRLSGEYMEFDALNRFHLDVSSSKTSGACIAGKILTGQQKPVDCSEFGLGCTPEKPMGAPMVSTEGACAAYYRYQRTTTTP